MLLPLPLLALMLPDVPRVLPAVNSHAAESALCNAGGVAWNLARQEHLL